MDDFLYREDVISKARLRYIPSHTMNITVAVQLYLINDSAGNRQIPLQVTAVTRPKNWVDKLGRPDCPVCGKSLLLRAIYTPRGRSNREGYQTCWECLGCGHERYSHKSISDRLREINQ